MPAEQFYDGLAAQYELLFDDWWTAAQRHGEVIGGLLASQGVVPPASVLDCTCGIGTQALPLAAAGYRLAATDLSSEAVARARAHAEARGIDLELSKADVRALPAAFTGRFDAVISCDNALPHLLSDADLVAALTEARRCLRRDGLVLVTMRDYDELREKGADGVPPTLMGRRGSRHGVAQAWRWAEDERTVDITLFVLVEEDNSWQVTVHECTYRALLRADMDDALAEAGFGAVRWHSPEDSGYYQPIVTARAG